MSVDDRLRRREDDADTCGEPCKFCATTNYQEFWVPACAAAMYCDEDVRALMGERNCYKTALEQLAENGEMPLTASNIIARRALHGWNTPPLSPIT
jgi:hypothetical protein